MYLIDKFIFYFKIIFNSCFVYFVWIVLHTISSHLYTKYCAPIGFIDILVSSLTVSTPHCYAFRWIINKSSFIIDNMWFILGGFVSLSLSRL